MLQAVSFFPAHNLKTDKEGEIAQDHGFSDSRRKHHFGSSAECHYVGLVLWCQKVTNSNSPQYINGKEQILN